MCHLESVFEDLHISTHFTRFYNVEKTWRQCMVIYLVLVAKIFSCCKMFKLLQKIYRYCPIVQGVVRRRGGGADGEQPHRFDHPHNLGREKRKRLLLMSHLPNNHHHQRMKFKSPLKGLMDQFRLCPILPLLQR